MEKDTISPDSLADISSKRKKSKKKKERDSSRDRKKTKKLKASKHSNSSESVNSRGNHKKAKEKQKLSRSSVSDGDVELDIKPLTSYLGDRQELHKQLFTIITKKELKGMLPDVLKKLEIKEIKKMCYDQLEILSRKRLRHIITGEDMDSSSSSADGGTDEDDEVKENCKPVQCTEDLADSEQVTEIESGQEEQNKPGPEDADLNIFQEMINAPNQEEIDKLVEGSVKEDSTNEDSVHDSLDEGRMEEEVAEEEEVIDASEEAELKMLEFRARALKSLVLARERQMKQKEIAK